MTILGLADFGSQTAEAFRALRIASKILPSFRDPRTITGRSRTKCCSYCADHHGTATIFFGTVGLIPNWFERGGFADQKVLESLIWAKLGSFKSLIDMTNQGKIRFISVVSDKPQFHNSGKSSFRTKILFPNFSKMENFKIWPHSTSFN